MASLLILQTATDAGLGSCFVGVPPAREAEVRAEFGIPEDHDPVGVITLGHRADGETPSGSPRVRRRRPLGDLVHRGRWGA
jgi:nitroreductase